VKIAFDMSFMTASSGTRCSLNTETLIKHLAKKVGLHRCHYFHPPHGSDHSQVQADLLNWIREHNIDLYVVLHPFELPYPEAINRETLGRAKLAVMVQDFIPRRYEYINNAVSAAPPLGHLNHFELVRKADLVWTNLESSRRDASLYGGIEPRRVHVVGEGISDKFRPLSSIDRQALKDRYGITKRYVMSSGDLAYRKNIDGLFAAFAKVNQELKRTRQLVVTQLPKEEQEGIKQLAEQFSISDDLVMTGRIGDDELSLLYNGAELFAFPTLYEGFASSLLEAIACNTPILASDNASMAEISGGRTRLINPENVNEMAAGMLDLIGMPHTSVTRFKASKAIRRFRWNSVSEAMLRSLRQLEYAAVLYPNRFWKTSKSARTSCFFSFSLDDIPKKILIKKASLVMSGSSGRTISVYRIKRGWNAPAASRRRPARSKAVLFKKTLSASKEGMPKTGKVKWKCIELARKWKEAPLSNHGLYVSGLDASNPPALYVSYVHLLKPARGASSIRRVQRRSR
jgi:glycosyltransferase involved in cell wall biosynthesis